MSARRNKKMKKLLLPFTFVLGVLAFPLGNMAFDQAKKTGKALFADEAPKKGQAQRVVHQQPKKSHKKATRTVAKQKKKVSKKVAKQKKPVKQQRRYAH
jgi:stringent starvation protein B